MKIEVKMISVSELLFVHKGTAPVCIFKVYYISIPYFETVKFRDFHFKYDFSYRSDILLDYLTSPKNCFFLTQVFSVNCPAD